MASLQSPVFGIGNIHVHTWTVSEMCKTARELYVLVVDFMRSHAVNVVLPSINYTYTLMHAS